MKSTLCALSLALALGASALSAATPVFTNDFVSVTLDGVRLGEDLDPANYSLFPSVVYDAPSGTYHMWVTTGSVLALESVRHATSTDGVHFTSTGSLSFAGGNPFPIYGAPAEPPMYFVRASKVGNDWKLVLWTHNEPAITGDYNYNESVNDIGSDPNTLAVAHQGPIYPTNGLGTFGQTTGPFGMIGGNLYVADDRPGGISKWDFNDTTPPSVATPADHYQDLITGTGYVYFLTHPGDPLGVYVHNIGRVVDQADGTLGVYYSLRHPDGTRVNKQIYYAESGDDGQSWSAPNGIFPNGDAVRVDGAPNQFEFSHPEVTMVGGRRVLYFSTKASDGHTVVATSVLQPPTPGSWSLLLGSGVNGDGEQGLAVIRTSSGGYAIAGNSSGLTQNPVGAWLVRLDGTGEVESQKVYTEPTPWPRFTTSLAEASDGGLVMAGLIGNVGETVWILKVHALGGVIWSTEITNFDPAVGSALEIWALVPTADGGFAFAGRVADYFGLGKVDALGALQWIRSYPAGAAPGSGFSTALSLVETPNGGLAAAGTFWSGGVRVLKTDSAGIPVWDETFSTGGLPGIALRQSGGFLLAGYNFAMALDDDGGVVWQKSYSGLPGGALVPLGDGGFGVSGSSASRALLAEIGDDGSPLWAKSFATQASSSSGFAAAAAGYGGGLLAAGHDIVGADSRLLAVKVDAAGEFVGCLDEEVSSPLTASSASFPASPLSDPGVDELANTTVGPDAVSEADTDASERILCRATLPPELAPAALVVDPNGNGVAEPGEEFLSEPAWTNLGPVAIVLSGHASALSDSNGLDTSDPDPDAGYGAIASLATADCFTATGDCYQFQFLDIQRPSQHWDTSFDETLSSADPHHRYAKRWIVHAGLSFADVAPASGYYPSIENIFHNGITVGCDSTDYCPGDSTTRAQMAVFLLKSRYGAAHQPPPATGTVFGDVPADQPFAAWIEEIASLGITAGCGNGNYCPDAPVTRQEMAVFLLKTLLSAAYVPPPPAGIFGDVPVDSPYAPWIEDLYGRHVTAGCDGQMLEYCPEDPNTREQMAVFLVRTFSLLLYKP